MREKVLFWLLAVIFIIFCLCILLFSVLFKHTDMIYVNEITSAAVITDISAAVSSAGSTLTAPEGSTQTALININTATAEELTVLPGIGEVISERIVEYREQNGNFGSIEEIKQVSGIGDAKFEAIKSLITV